MSTSIHHHSQIGGTDNKQEQQPPDDRYWSAAFDHGIVAVQEMYSRVLKQYPEEPIELEASLRLLNTTTGGLHFGKNAADLGREVFEQILRYTKLEHSTAPARTTTSSDQTQPQGAATTEWQMSQDLFYRDVRDTESKSAIRCSLRFPDNSNDNNNNSNDNTSRNSSRAAATHSEWIKKLTIDYVDLVVPERRIGIRVSAKLELPISPPPTEAEQSRFLQLSQVRNKKRFVVRHHQGKYESAFTMVWQGNTALEAQVAEPAYEIEEEVLMQQEQGNGKSTSKLIQTSDELKQMCGDLLLQMVALLGFVEPLSIQLASNTTSSVQ
jgi:hypothetical protein